MKKLLTLLCTIITATLLADTPTPPSLADVNAQFASSVALVAYKFKAAVPGKAYMGFTGEWCANCNKFHSRSLGNFLRDDKSMYAVGFDDGIGNIITQDFAIPSENIASITVDGKTAEIVEIIPGRGAVILQVDGERLHEAKGFVAPEFYATINLQALIRSRGFDKSEPIIAAVKPIVDGARIESPAILLDADGGFVGYTFDSVDLPYHSSADTYTPAELAELETLAIENAKRYVVPVTFKYRAPPRPTGAQQQQRNRWDDDDEGAEIMEFETQAYRVNDTRLLIFSDDTHIWRLASITVKHGDDEIPATFAHAYRHINFVAADVEGGSLPPLPAPMYADDDDPASEIPVFAISSVDAGNGKLEFSAARALLPRPTPGWRDLPCYESISSRYESGTDSSERPDLVFPFGADVPPVAWLVVRDRGRDAIGERYSYNRTETELLSTTTLAAFVNPAPAEINASVRPLPMADRKPQGSFGIDLQPVTAELAKNRSIMRLTNSGRNGAIVTAVTPGSPAAAAGVEENWVMLSILPEGARTPIGIRVEEDRFGFGNEFPWEQLDGIPEQYFSQIPAPWKASASALDKALGGYGVGTKVDANFILPGGSVRTLTLTVAEAPPTYENAPFHNWREAGFTLCELTHEVRTYLGLDADAPGLVVRGARGGTPAIKAGLRPLELVTHVNNEPMNSLDDFKKIAVKEGSFTLNVTRLDKSRLVVFELK